MSRQKDERLPRQIGRYVLHHEFAAGGMAAVYLGQLVGPVGFSRVVAIKRMHSMFAEDKAFVEMFVDEAWLAARVQHPNVVSTLEVVVDAGELFIVMDYVRGESLSRLLADSKQIVPVDVAAGIVAQALAGLHAAHRATDESGRPLGIIHRDISPQNILVGADGLSRITDFGVAKAASRLHVTQEGQLKGKLRYMPPEQLLGDARIDLSADTYAMGVVLWETLAKRRLFRGSTLEELADSIINAPTPLLHRERSDVPRQVDDVLAKALSRDPQARYRSAEEFQIDLERASALASPRAIGAWVHEVAGPLLASKKALVDLIEQGAKSRKSVALELERMRKRGEPPVANVEQPAAHQPARTEPMPGRVHEATTNVERAPWPAIAEEGTTTVVNPPNPINPGRSAPTDTITATMTAPMTLARAAAEPRSQSARRPRRQAAIAAAAVVGLVGVGVAAMVLPAESTKEASATTPTSSTVQATTTLPSIAVIPVSAPATQTVTVPATPRSAVSATASTLRTSSAAVQSRPTKAPPAALSTKPAVPDTIVPETP
ncbi:MAG: protein kinase [Polyangiaceae bacterium]